MCMRKECLVNDAVTISQKTVYLGIWPSPLVSVTNMDASCAETQPVTVVGVLLGSVLALATFLLPFPQAYKLLKQRSSAGLSPLTLALTILFAGTNVGATVAIKWHQLEACASGPGCLGNLLDLVQQAASWVTWVMIVSICVSLPPNRMARTGCVALLSVLSTIAVVVVAAVVSAAAPCTSSTLGYSQVLAYIAGVAAATQYGPQLYETWSHGSAGSLSFVTYIIQTVGSVLVVLNQTVILKDSWPVWLPLLVSSVMQSGVLALTFWLKKHPRKTATAPAGDNNSGDGRSTIIFRQALLADDARVLADAGRQ